MDIEDRIIDCVKDKEVLEIGGLGEFLWYEKKQFKSWRHARIKSLTKTLTGIDINSEYVDRAKANGFNYKTADIENRRSLGNMGRFDVILFIDVIEHLNNVMAALKNIRILLRDGGILVMTTPNPYAFNNIFRIFTGRPPGDYYDHTCAFMRSHMEVLFTRADMRVRNAEYVSFVDPRAAYRFKSKIISLAGRIKPILNTHLFIISSMTGEND